MNDDTIGGMVVCDSSEQARCICRDEETKFSSALILHDEDDTDTRKANRNAFKKDKLIFLLFTTCF